MKYTLITMMLGLASVATAGQKLVVAEPTPAPAAPAWGVELGGTYGWGLRQYMKSPVIGKKNHMNQVGGDITGVYNLDENNAVTLRFGYTYGGDKFGMALVDDEGMRLEDVNTTVKERLHTFTLMPGYRFTYALNEDWSVFAGANVGIAAASSKLEVSHQIDRRSDLTASAHKSAWGFAWSVEAGVKYNVAENVNVFAAAVWSGNTARPNIKFAGEGVGRVHAQQTLGVRAGVGFTF